MANQNDDEKSVMWRTKVGSITVLQGSCVICRVGDAEVFVEQNLEEAHGLLQQLTPALGDVVDQDVQSVVSELSEMKKERAEVVAILGTGYPAAAAFTVKEVAEFVMKQRAELEGQLTRAFDKARDVTHAVAVADAELRGTQDELKKVREVLAEGYPFCASFQFEEVGKTMTTLQLAAYVMKEMKAAKKALAAAQVARDQKETSGRPTSEAEWVAVDHDLKIWPEQFAAVMSGQKRYEIRVNDRDYVSGQRVLLREFDPETAKYTGRGVLATIGHLTPPGQWGLSDNVCVFSIDLDRDERRTMDRVAATRAQSARDRFRAERDKFVAMIERIQKATGTATVISLKWRDHQGAGIDWDATVSAIVEAVLRVTKENSDLRRKMNGMKWSTEGMQAIERELEDLRRILGAKEDEPLSSAAMRAMQMRAAKEMDFQIDRGQQIDRARRMGATVEAKLAETVRLMQRLGAMLANVKG